MEKIDEVLNGIKLLNTKLYGDNGFTGDIPEIKRTMKETCQRLEQQSLEVNTLKVKQKEHLKESRIQGGASGGATGFLAAAIAIILDYFLRR